MHTEYFLNRSIPVPESGCWLWEGCTDPQGYGQVRTRGKTCAAHREAYRAFNGDIPAGLVVMHTCDTPRCINPGHLRLGTYADNNLDKALKGRALYGERHPRAKLCLADVQAIRVSTEPRAALAKKYGVGLTAVARILTGRAWAQTP